MSVKTPRYITDVWASKAEAGTVNDVPDVPNPSDIIQKPSLASYSTGFPSVSMSKPPVGKPAYGQDVNGVLKDITAILQYFQAGNTAPYDATFQKAINGYNKSAIVLNNNDNKLYLSLVDNNTAALSDTKSWTIYNSEYLPLTGGHITGGLTVDDGILSLDNINIKKTSSSDSAGIIIASNTGNGEDYKGYIVRTNKGSFEVTDSDNKKTVMGYYPDKEEFIIPYGLYITPASGGSELSKALTKSDMPPPFVRQEVIDPPVAAASYEDQGDVTFKAQLRGKEVTFQLKWGTVDYSGWPPEQDETVTFKYPFPTACLCAGATRKVIAGSTGESNDGGVLLVQALAAELTVNLTIFYRGATNTRGFTWWAVGY